MAAEKGFSLALGLSLFCAACTNSPYPESDSRQNVYYTTFDDPTKTLDPAISYTTTEHEITGTLYDTLVEYHYLKRPYELILGLATEVPKAEPLADVKVRYR